MGDKRLTARAFHEADGVDDWRVLYSGANAYYRVASFAPHSCPPGGTCNVDPGEAGPKTTVPTSFPGPSGPADTRTTLFRRTLEASRSFSRSPMWRLLGPPSRI